MIAPRKRKNATPASKRTRPPWPASMKSPKPRPSISRHCNGFASNTKIASASWKSATLKMATWAIAYFPRITNGWSRRPFWSNAKRFFNCATSASSSTKSCAAFNVTSISPRPGWLVASPSETLDQQFAFRSRLAPAADKTVMDAPALSRGLGLSLSQKEARKAFQEEPRGRAVVIAQARLAQPEGPLADNLDLFL